MRKKKIQVLVLHGPNLNLLGRRESDVYGKITLKEIERELDDLAKQKGIQLKFFQSNSEGALIDFLQMHFGKVDGLLINPGALTHYSFALHDAIRALSVPAVEVHLTNLHRREEWRKSSVITSACVGLLMGFGAASYTLGLEALLGAIGRNK